MKQLFKIACLIAITVLFTTAAQAQEQEHVAKQRHEFSVYGLGGLSLINYTLSGGKTEGTISGGGGVGYTFFFTKNLGITTGAELSFFNAMASVDAITNSTEFKNIDVGGRTEDMHFTSKLDKYKESQKATYVHIPLLLQFQSGVFFAAAGAKVGFAVDGKYEVTGGQLHTGGFFQESGQTFTDMPNHGFVTQEATHSGNLSFGLNAALSIEAGVRLTVNDNVKLYAGAYADYGLLDVSPAKEKALPVNYQPATPAQFAYHSILTAQQQTGKAYVDKINLLSVGIKLRLAFGAIR